MAHTGNGSGIPTAFLRKQAVVGSCLESAVYLEGTIIAHFCGHCEILTVYHVLPSGEMIPEPVSLLQRIQYPGTGIGKISRSRLDHRVRIFQIKLLALIFQHRFQGDVPILPDHIQIPGNPIGDLHTQSVLIIDIDNRRPQGNRCVAFCGFASIIADHRGTAASFLSGSRTPAGVKRRESACLFHRQRSI